MVKIENFYPGYVIIREGEEIDTAFVIKSGTVEVFRKISENEIISLAKLGPGQIFGEMSLFGNKKSSASVRALNNVSVQVIDKKVFHEYLEQTPPLIKMLLEILADRLNKTTQKLLLASYMETQHKKENEIFPIDLNQKRGKE